MSVLPTSKVLTIVGPTSSGKTALSLSLARHFDGEIISADSRQIYRGLDIGTGKATTEEQGLVPHHLLDIRKPTETFNVSEYIDLGRKVIDDIHVRNKIPIIVGGTFHYIDALLGKASFPAIPPIPHIRDELEKRHVSELFTELLSKDANRAKTIDPQNKRRIIRALEILTVLPRVPEKKVKPLYTSFTIGISIEREELRTRIVSRLTERLQSGMLEETHSLLAQGIPAVTLSSRGIEYDEMIAYTLNQKSYEEMKQGIITRSMRYAKRQMTWLKRDASIRWYALNTPRAIDMIKTDVTIFLNPR